MCGIAGIDRAEASTEVEQMLQQLRHRGPDGSGLDSAAGCTLGHTRLAIIDVAGGRQPILQRATRDHVQRRNLQSPGAAAAPSARSAVCTPARIPK